MSKNTEFTVDPEQLDQDLAELTALKDDVSAANGELRSAIGQKIETRGYHKNALKTIREIDDMATTKMADFMRSFEPMFEARLPIWREKIQDMLDKLDAETSEMESDMK